MEPQAGVCTCLGTHTVPNVIIRGAGGVNSRKVLEHQRDSVVVVACRRELDGREHVAVRVRHRVASAGPRQHRQVVGHVTERNDVFALDATLRARARPSAVPW